MSADNKIVATVWHEGINYRVTDHGEDFEVCLSDGTGHRWYSKHQALEDKEDILSALSTHLGGTIERHQVEFYLVPDQFITNDRFNYFIVKDSEPLVHFSLKRYPTYEAMLSEVSKMTSTDIDEILGAELVLVKQADDHFTFIIHGQRFDNVGYNLISYMINFEM